MRKIGIGAVVVALAVAVSAASTAVDAHSKKKKKRSYERPSAAQRYSAPRESDYHEYIADRLPFGSKLWWEQMDREGRGGQSRAN
jgi:hypothetical protein